MVEIIVALSMHPQLEELRLPGMGIGRNECTALATLLRNTTKQLQTLNLSNNNIDDEAIEVLVHSIGASELRYLILIGNRSITAKGLKALSTLLEMPESNLEELKLLYNNIGNRWALIFTNALRGNIKLKTLALGGNNITDVGWAPFSTLLCDTSSVNETYLSNHTLLDLGLMHRYLPTDLVSYLVLNARCKQ